eukprot:scaffold5311_cov120-Isochrysis_galbana.AAC.1
MGCGRGVGEGWDGCGRGWNTAARASPSLCASLGVRKTTNGHRGGEAGCVRRRGWRRGLCCGVAKATRPLAQAVWLAASRCAHRLFD